MKVSYYYILDEYGDPVEEPDFMCWARLFEKNVGNRHVALYERDGCRVSTVFLGLDHRFGDKGPPLLYETMTFNDESWIFNDREHIGKDFLEMSRYSTRDDALIGHEKHVKALDDYLDQVKGQVCEAFEHNDKPA